MVLFDILFLILRYFRLFINTFPVKKMLISLFEQFIQLNSLLTQDPTNYFLGAHTQCREFGSLKGHWIGYISLVYKKWKKIGTKSDRKAVYKMKLSFRATTSAAIDVLLLTLTVSTLYISFATLNDAVRLYLPTSWLPFLLVRWISINKLVGYRLILRIVWYSVL